MPKLSCRNCGYELVDRSEAKQAVQQVYNYTDSELDAKTIKVWCPQCAVADSRVDEIAEVAGDFHWEVIH